MSGLNQIQFGFKNLLKNGFEKLGKEKRKEILSAIGPLLLPQPQPRPASPRAARLLPRPPRFPWAELKPRPVGPSSRARLRPASAADRR
jgi:hypothetical protein